MRSKVSREDRKFAARSRLWRAAFVGEKSSPKKTKMKKTNWMTEASDNVPTKSEGVF